MTSRVRVAVLVDLFLDENSGGHVKVWERFAHVAVDFGNVVDLTIFFLGDKAKEIILSSHVRYQLVPPRLGTNRFRFLHQGGGHTELSPYHPDLAKQLEFYDIIHVTSAFGFGKTGYRVARKLGKALITSVHTDVPNLTRVYTRDIIHNILGSKNFLAKLVLDYLKLPELVARHQSEKIDEFLRKSDCVLVSNQKDLDRVRDFHTPDSVRFLRRGIDKTIFSPDHRDRKWLCSEFAIPADNFVVIFVGRVDESKRVWTVVDAVRLMVDQGRAVHLMICGEGGEMTKIKAILATHVTLTGNVPQKQLGRILACSDLFAFPSEIETAGNVVIEAKACGLPVIVSKHGISKQFIENPGIDGIILDDRNAQAWSDEILKFLDDPDLPMQMSRAARQYVERKSPSWAQVFAEDLLSVWLSLADKPQVTTHNEIAALSLSRDSGGSSLT